MSGIKGLVLLTRYDFIEIKYGKDALKSFFNELDLEDKTSVLQPVLISKDYPEIILKGVDSTMLKKFFNNDEKSFYEVGRWNARHLMPKYFQLYIDEKNPDEFLRQMARMRDILIGLGEMTLAEMEKNNFIIRINYGQTYLESVRLSETGFLEEGCILCGVKNIQVEELNINSTSVEYQFTWEKQ